MRRQRRQLTPITYHPGSRIHLNLFTPATTPPATASRAALSKVGSGLQVRRASRPTWPILNLLLAERANVSLELWFRRSWRATTGDARSRTGILTSDFSAD